MAHNMGVCACLKASFCADLTSCFVRRARGEAGVACGCLTWGGRTGFGSSNGKSSGFNLGNPWLEKNERYAMKKIHLNSLKNRKTNKQTKKETWCDLYKTWMSIILYLSKDYVIYLPLCDLDRQQEKNHWQLTSWNVFL